jgi:hypothetical protein
MVRAITLLLLISLHSLTYADNTVIVQTKGSGSSISVQQVGSGNVTGVYCGLGSFDNRQRQRRFDTGHW